MLDHATLLDDIRALVDVPVSGERTRFLAQMERTLTDGYAQVLALETERIHLERRLGADVAERERARLRDLLKQADAYLAELRPLLDSLRRQASRLRAA